MWHHAEHRDPGAKGQHVEAWTKERHVSTKLVDDEATDTSSIFGVEQFDRPEEGREDPTPINVANEEHDRIGHASDTHVDDLTVAEIDFRGTPRALDDDQFVGLPESSEALLDDGQERRVHLSVRFEIDRRERPTADHDLRAMIRLRLQQNRVHVDGWLDAGRFGLSSLGAPDLAAVDGYTRIQRHVLRLERRNPIACAREPPTQGRREYALADTRARSLEHETGSKHAHGDADSATATVTYRPSPSRR